MAYGAVADEAATLTTPIQVRSESADSIHVGFQSRRGSSVVAAAVAIADAVTGVDRQQPLVRRQSQRAFRVHLWLDPLAQGSALSLVLLTFWEAPRWCRGEKAQMCRCVWDPDAPEVCPYPTYDIAYVDERVAVAIQLVAITLIAAHLLLARIAVGAQRFWSWDGKGWVMVVCLLKALDSVRALVVVLGVDALEVEAWRPAPYLRLLLLIGYSSDVRSQLRLVSKILPAFCRIGALVGCLVLFAAWFGVVIFPPNTMEGSEELPNFREAAWQLIVTLTTANFPDVMLPAYERNRWPATLFFGSFLALGMFFMMNLLLATVYNTYSEERAADSLKRDRRRVQYVEDAFELLSEDGVVKPEKLAALLKQLNEHQDIKYVSEDTATRIFDRLDQRHDGHLSRDEFEGLVDALRAEASRPWTSEDRPSSAWRASIGELVASRKFEYVVDGL